MLKRMTLGLALLLASCAGAPKIIGSGAPDFYLSDQDGKNWDTTAMKGQALLLDFWAPWCAPCLESVPDLNAFHEKYGAKVQLLGIAIEPKGWDAVRPVIAKYGISYPVMIGHANLGKAYSVEALPTLVLVRQGKVAKVLKGKHSLKDLEEALHDVLN